MAIKYTQEEILLIAGHLTPLITVATKTAEKYCKVNAKAPSEQARGSIVYWTNVASGLKWALEQAASQAERGVKDDGNNLRHSKAGPVKRG